MPRPLDMKLVAKKFGKLKKVKPGQCVYCGHKANAGGTLCPKHSLDYRKWRSNAELNLARQAAAKIVGVSPMTRGKRLSHRVVPTAAMHKALLNLATMNAQHKHVMRLVERIAKLVDAGLAKAPAPDGLPLVEVL